MTIEPCLVTHPLSQTCDVSAWNASVVNVAPRGSRCCHEPLRHRFYQCVSHGKGLHRVNQRDDFNGSLCQYRDTQLRTRHTHAHVTG